MIKWRHSSIVSLVVITINLDAKRLGFVISALIIVSYFAWILKGSDEMQGEFESLSHH